MNTVLEVLFSQYATYKSIDVVLEITAVFFGITSVWCSKKNNILVFPTGMISTLIFVYLLFKWGLLGDMLINGYYFIMSIYGWYIWTRKSNGSFTSPISKMTLKNQKTTVFIFIITLIFVYIVYIYFNKWTSWTAYVDSFTTAIFFVAMWLMTKRKIENWLFWIVGNVISVPLYFYKGFSFTSFQYLIFTIVAVYGYLEWKKNLTKSQLIA